MSNPQRRHRALITGASTGIGALYADRLARRGFDLVIVARNARRLDAVADRISSETGRAVTAVRADLAKPDDLARVEDLIRTDAGLGVLVNNAGVGATAPLLASDVDDMSSMIALNVGALTRLTYAAAPAFAARREGTIINVASVVALAPEILNGVYGGTKAFVLALTQSLQSELAEHGVRVQAVLPGATATEFWDVAGGSIESLPPGMVMSAADLVDAALAGLDAGEVITIPSLPDAADWEAYEGLRQALRPGLSLSVPAARYGLGAARRAPAPAL